MCFLLGSPPPSSVFTTCLPRSGHKCMRRGLAAHIKEEGDSRLLDKKRLLPARERAGERPRRREGERELKDLIGGSSAQDAREELHNQRSKGSPKSRKASLLFQLPSNSGCKWILFAASLSIFCLTLHLFLLKKKKTTKKQNPTATDSEEEKHPKLEKTCVGARPSCSC